jgi:cell division protein FtsW
MQTVANNLLLKLPRKLKMKRNYQLFIGSVAFLTLGGLVMVFSASSAAAIAQTGNIYGLSWKQGAAIIISAPIAWLASQLPLERWKTLARLGVLISAGSLSLLQVKAISKSVNGNTNWITIGPFDLQPSEIAKFFLILWAGNLIARQSTKRDKNFAYSLVGGFIISLVLVLAGKDLGSAIVMGSIMLALVWISGLPARFISFISAAGVIAVSTLILSQPYRRDRFLAVLNPFAEGTYKNAGWQPAHSIMALASGGIFGVGLGGSRQKWGNLPEAHTDFIFSIIGEELGLVGTLSVIIGIGILIYSTIRISLSARDQMSRFVGIGIASWIAIQSIINLGSATGVFPVVGVTLPFVSYGGSSMIALALAVGYVAGIAFRDPELKSEINTAWPRQRA